MAENRKGLRKETLLAYRACALIVRAHTGPSRVLSPVFRESSFVYGYASFSMEQHTNTVRPLYRGTQIVWYIFYVIETMLLFRFLLKLIGANPAAFFTDIIYTLSYPFAAPFLYVVNFTQVSGSVFEWTMLIAMAVYWVFAWGIVRLFVMGKPVSRAEADVKLQNQDAA